MMMSFLNKKRLAARFVEIFGLDTRSLAAARIALGLLVLLDIAGRVVDYGAFYTESGILSRAKALELYSWRESISFFMVSGATWWAGFCFLIEAAGALCFSFGYRTRLACLLTWLMLIGSQGRFTPVVQGGDALLRLLLFWSFFLPMSARFSLDAKKSLRVSAPPTTVVGVATIALYFQVLAVYIFAALLKDGPAWHDGTALYYSLQLITFSKQPLAGWLLDHEVLMSYLTYGTYYLERYGPALFLIPFFVGRLRTALVFTFMGLHLGFFCFMDIGLFPWKSMAGWIFLLPAWFWEKCHWRLGAQQISSSVLLGWSWCSAVRSRFARALRLAFVSAPPLFLLWLVFQWNMESIGQENWKLTGFQRSWSYSLRLRQKWNMFSPSPSKVSGWYSIPGQLVSGEEVDLWQGGTPSWATEAEQNEWTKKLPEAGKEEDVLTRLSRRVPEDVPATYKNQRWNKFMAHVRAKKHLKLRSPFAKYLCRKWNSGHKGDQKLKTFQIIFMKKVTPKPGAPMNEIVPTSLWLQNCIKAKKKSPKKKPLRVTASASGTDSQ